MATLREVPLSLTEDALHLLHATHADLLSRGSPPVPHGRIRAGSKLASFDAKEVRLEACYLRLVSIVEAYVDVLCSELFREASVNQSDLFRALIDAAESRASANWDERKTAFKNYHGAVLTSCSSWSTFYGAVEVRNAIAHGLGRLTARQRAGSSRQKIESVGVVIVDDSIRLSYEAVLRCLSAARTFVVSLDSRVKRPTVL